MKLYTYKELLESGITPDYEPLDENNFYFFKEGDRIAAVFAVNYKKE